MIKQKPYQIELFYGFEECEDGIWHAFEVCDPDTFPCEDEIGQKLANTLQVSPNSFSFKFDSMYINLPESVVEKIRADAVKEYIGNMGR